ncbi:MAG TPA: hypothetical protein VKH81_23165 [Candidatus Angelobacter sp.]|nr:hypothetical protein [Candidatus Angelobacter sp.]
MPRIRMSTMSVLFLLIVICGRLALRAWPTTFDDPPAEQVFVGVVSDYACGSKHTMHPNLTAADCTKLCHELGSKFSLVMGDKVYALEGNTEGLTQIAGEKAVIRGVLNGQTQVIRVISLVGGKPR